MARSMNKHLYVAAHHDRPTMDHTNTNAFSDHGACLQTATAVIQALEDGEPDITHNFWALIIDFDSIWSSARST
jgi:hypothetical protein